MGSIRKNRSLLITGCFSLGLLIACGGGGGSTPAPADGARYAAVGTSGIIYRSPDGAAWTECASGTSSNLNAVAWNGTVYCAVGESGTVLRSPDGVTWTPATIAFSNGLNGIAAHNGTFCAVGDGGAIFISSDNGNTWNAPTPSPGISADLNAVSWYGSRFCAVGNNGVTSTSISGDPWAVPVSVDPSAMLTAVTSHAGAIVAMDARGSIYRATHQGVTWSKDITASYFIMQGLASNGSKILASGFENMAGGRIYSSTGLASWESTAWTDPATSHALSGMIWDGTRFIAFGSNGCVVVSTDGSGTSWTIHSVGTTSQTIAGMAFR